MTAMKKKELMYICSTLMKKSVSCRDIDALFKYLIESRHLEIRYLFYTKTFNDIGNIIKVQRQRFKALTSVTNML